MKKFSGIWMLLIVLSGSANLIYSQVPSTLTYQAKISDSGGPVNGIHNLTFIIYDAVTGGNALWTETNTGITVTAGNFSIILGKNNPITIQTDKPMWLGVTVDSNPEISPRVELTGSLYSLGIGLPYSATSSLPTSLFSITATADGARAGEFTHSGTNSGQAALFATSTGGNLAFLGMNSGANEGAASLFTTNPSNPTATLRVYNSGSGSAIDLNSTNTSGSSPVLKISNSGTGNAITANGKIQATQFIGDGSLLTNLPSGIALPYNNGTQTPGVSFRISNLAVSGSAGEFMITEATNSSPVLSISNSSTGLGLMSNSAIGVYNNTTNRGAGDFQISNSSNNNTSLSAATVGNGYAFAATNLGTGAFASAARFSNTNAANTSAVVTINNAGTGNAITANRPIQATKFIGDGSLLTGLPTGLNLPYTGSSAAGANAFDVTNTGTSGYAGSFAITNAANSESSLFVSTFGTGNAIRALSTGASAAYLQILNDLSPYDALFVITNGTGPAGHFIQDNTSSTSEALITKNKGKGSSLWATNQGPSPTINASNEGSGAVIFASSNGTNGEAGLFNITNSANWSTAVSISTQGTGNVLNLNHTGISGDIALFRSGGTAVARVDKNGKGFFNGGTQTGGADVAEMFDVEGASNQYEPGDVLVISEKTDRTVEKCSEPNSTKIAGVYATKPGVVLTERDIEEKLDDMVPMGVVGVLPTKVCSENGSIKRGDLLVTSSITGHAMKAIPVEINGVKIYLTGAILGKALENFDGDRGVVKVLVNVK